MAISSKQPDIIDILNKSIDTICSDISKYAENPGIDFKRVRKLPAPTLMRFSVNMEGNTLSAEIYNNFPLSENRMSVSAYEQQRDKLKPEAFLDLLYLFNSQFTNAKTLKGLRVYAIDGSDFNTPLNKDSEWYIPNHYIRKDGQEAKGTCLLHGNFLYDLLNKQYMDVNITRDEREGAIQLIKNIKDASNSLVIMDRGYSGYNMIEHCNRYGGYYVIRNPISNTIKEINELPDKQCDTDMEIKVSTKSKQWCDLYGYRKIYVRKNKKLADYYSEKTNDSQWDFEEKSVVRFRVCKFQINAPNSDKPTWEVLVTNLPRSKFPLKSMKRVYHLRWGIETSFLELKYAVGGINFHSKKDKYILQELFAHLVAYNAASRIAACIPVKQSEKGIAYVVDFKMVVHIFRIYFRRDNKAPPDDMYADMTRYRHMIRNGRYNMRLLRPKSAVYFTYRVA